MLISLVLRLTPGVPVRAQPVHIAIFGYGRSRTGFSSVQKRQDYPDVSETLQEQVTKLVNVMRTIAAVDGLRFSDVS